MGFVTCGTHKRRCCWRCDKCPACEGTFKRVGRGDYCPDCTAWMKANGYVWSEYYKDYVSPKEDTEEGGQRKLDNFKAAIRGFVSPMPEIEGK